MTDGQNRVCGVVSILLAVVNAIGILGSAGALVLQRVTFMEIFTDLGVALPFPTRVVLIIPNSVIILSTLVLLALLVGKEFIGRKAIPLILNIAWIAAGFAVSLLLAWALMAPMADAMGAM
jgi:hypothetical protein